jgi:glycosyltransferase involved in cell wall biosynthesis
MIKVLWYGDFLRSTGFGGVSEALISRLMKTGEYEFTVLAVNYFGEPYNVPSSPYYQFKDIPVYPAADESGDPFGRRQLLRMLMKGDFDLLFAMQDTFNMVPLHTPLKDICEKKKIAYVFYFPVDGDLDKKWVEQGVLTADYPVAYTQFGATEVNKHAPDAKVSVIPHGVDTGLFYPLNEEERRDFRNDELKVSDDDFLITNVNRYQPRKDLPRTIIAWTKIKSRIPNSKLCLHMNLSNKLDNSQELAGFIRRYVPEEMQKDLLWQSSSGDGVPVEDMRMKRWPAKCLS